MSKIGSVSVFVEEFNADNKIWKAYGATVPTDGGAGAAKGCQFVKTGGSTGTTLYINEGSATSCDFNAVEAGTPVFANNEAILDTNGNELQVFGVTASAVNEIKVTNASTGSGPTIAAQGGDTNVDLNITSKGTGKVNLGSNTSAGVVLAGDQAILDSSSNEYIKFVKTPSAVNEISVGNAAAGSGPGFFSTGGDTNIDISVGGKGTGILKTGSRGTATAAGGAATSNTQSGVITTEALVTAAGAQYTLTLTNDKIGFGAVLLVTVGNGTNSAGTPSLVVASQGSGSATIVVQNIHSANAFNGTLKISFLVM